MIGAITLDTGGDTIKILVISAVVGAIASLVSELLVVRGKAAETGVFVKPRAISARLYDLGSWASIPVGILAACIAGLMLTPVKEVVEGGKTTQTMGLENLLVVAAIAGLASASFLTVLADRFVAALKAKGLDVALQDSIAALKDIEQNPDPPAAGGGASSPGSVTERARLAAKAAEDRRQELMG